MPCIAKICLDHTHLLGVEVLAQHCLVIAHKIIVDVGEIEQAYSLCGFFQGILLFEDWLYGLIELLLLHLELDQELVEDLLASDIWLQIGMMVEKLLLKGKETVGILIRLRLG